MIKLGDAKLFHVYKVSKINKVFIPLSKNNIKTHGLCDPNYDLPNIDAIFIENFFNTIDDDLILKEYKPDYPEKYIKFIFEK